MHVHRGEPAAGIVEIAAEEKAGIVIMPSRGRATGREEIGKIAEEMLKHSKTPVIFCPGLTSRPYAPPELEKAAAQPSCFSPKQILFLPQSFALYIALSACRMKAIFFLPASCPPARPQKRMRLRRCRLSPRRYYKAARSGPCPSGKPPAVWLSVPSGQQVRLVPAFTRQDDGELVAPISHYAGILPFQGVAD